MFSLFKPAPATATTTGAAAATATAPAAEDLPTATPAVDLLDNGREVLLYADLPGVDASGLEVMIEGDRLTLRGTPTWRNPQGLSPAYQEYGPRVFERTFALSDTIDRERIAVRLNAGVATVTLPRRDAVAPRKVQVQVA